MKRYITLPEKVTPSMLHLSFWQDTSGGKVLLTGREIQSYNRRCEAESLCLSPLLWNRQEQFGRQRLLHLIESMGQPKAEWYAGTAPIGQTTAGRIVSRMALESIPMQVSPEYGVAVSSTSARLWPDDTFLTEKAGQSYDLSRQSEVRINDPLLLLHRSDDGAWWFAQGPGFGGWIPARDIAVFQDHQAWKAWFSRSMFLTVSRPVVYFEDSMADHILPLRMGTVLPLAEVSRSPETIGHRMGDGCCTVLLPKRDSQGMFSFSYAFMPAGDGFTIGYGAYTADELLRRALSFNGMRYGWGGDFGSYDCSGMIYALFRGFGFSFPRNSAEQAELPGKRRNLQGMGTDARKRELCAAAPGSLLYMPGHICLYLGHYGGEFYAISAVGSYMDESGTRREAQSVTITPLSIRRGNGESWFDSITRIITIR